MNNQSLLTFTLHGLHLAIETSVVREILWLPELTLVEECPAFIAGVINIRGRIVPVMDLNCRFGHPPQRYRPTDRVIILEITEAAAMAPAASPAEGLAGQAHVEQLGIIVNEVLDVLDIPAEHIEPPPFAGSDYWPHPRFVAGEVRAGGDIIMLLSHRRILEADTASAEAAVENPPSLQRALPDYFCPEAEPLERGLFHDRAVALGQLFERNEAAKSFAVAVVSLNGEFLGVELGAVREFARIHNFTPVPCCPRHIAGNMNLRGNVLTVVDVRGLLNMPAGRISDSAKVVVADLGGFSLGLIVDEIVDVINLCETDLVALPADIKALDEKFVKGAAPFAGRILALLDLPALLGWEGLLVNETV